MNMQIAYNSKFDRNLLLERETKKLIFYAFVLINIHILNIFVNASILALVLLTFVLVDIALTKPYVMLKYTYMLLGIYLNVLSNTIIEYSNLYLSELAQWSHPARSTTLLVTYQMEIILTVLILETKNSGHRRFSSTGFTIDKLAEKFMIVLVFIIMLASILMFQQGLSTSYFRLLTDRFAIKNNFLSDWQRRIYDNFKYFIPILIIALYQKRTRIVSLLSIVLYSVGILLLGEKFTGFITMFSLGLLTICVLKYEDIKRRYKVILVSIGAAVGIFVLFVVIQYSLLYGGDIWKNLTSRLSMQGQLFWSTYNKMKSDTLHIKELGSEIAVFFNRPALAAVGGSMEYGIRKIMMYNAPSTMVVTKIASGASYTDSTSSSLYYYFGSSGLLLGGLAVGSIYYHMTDYLASVIKRKNIIEIVFAMSLYWKLWITCGMSDIQTLFQWSSLAIYAVLIVFKFFRIMDKKRIKTIQLTDEVHSEK